MNISVLGILYPLGSLVWGRSRCLILHGEGSPFKLQPSGRRVPGFGQLWFHLSGLMKAPWRVLCAALGGLSANFVGDSFYMYDIRRVGRRFRRCWGTYPLFAALLSVTVLREPMTAGSWQGRHRPCRTHSVPVRGGENAAPAGGREGLLLSLLAAFFWGVSFVSARWAVTRAA